MSAGSQEAAPTTTAEHSEEGSQCRLSPWLHLNTDPALLMLLVCTQSGFDGVAEHRILLVPVMLSWQQADDADSDMKLKVAGPTKKVWHRA